MKNISADSEMADGRGGSKNMVENIANWCGGSGARSGENQRDISVKKKAFKSGIEKRATRTAAVTVAHKRKRCWQLASVITLRVRGGRVDNSVTIVYRASVDDNGHQ